MDNSSRFQCGQYLVVRVLIPVGKQELEIDELRTMDCQPEDVSKHLLQPACAQSMYDMLVHRPTLQGMSVLVKPLVLLWGEGQPAPLAYVLWRSALCDVPLDPARSDNQVECQF